MIRILRNATTVAIALWSSLAFADDFRPVPNKIKYSDTGVPDAKGSSGAAAIEVRALFNKNGSTDVEATTGAFDGDAAATGTIKNVHIDVNGQTFDYTGNDGSTFAATGIAGLAPTSTVPVHANVKDLSGSNENVKVSTVVKKRPDLGIIAIRSTQHVMVGMPGNIVTTIREQNRQSGARANCVAYHDGVEVDRADGIWVDAGGTVDCVLTPTLHVAGLQHVLVKIENVTPGDWDTADNAVHASMRVHDYDEQFSSWSAMARDEEASYYERYRSPNSEMISSNSGFRASASVEGTQNELLDVSTMLLDFSVSSDGVSFADVRGVAVTGWTRGTGVNCGRAFIGNVRAQICTWQRTPNEIRYNLGRTVFSASAVNADVTYYSKYWSVWYDPNGTPNVYHSESTSRQKSGTTQRLGNTVAMRLSVTDGTRTLWSEPFLTLENYDYQRESNECWGETCYESRADVKQMFGSSYGYND